MSEDKFRSISESLKFFDPQLCFPILDFYLNSSVFKNHPRDQFHDKLLHLKQELLFRRTFLFEEQAKFLSEVQNKDQVPSVNINDAKAKFAQNEKDLNSSLLRFLNLLETCEKEKNYETTSSFRMKAYDETPFSKVLEYLKMIYNNGRYGEARIILNNLHKICLERKEISKVLLALWLIFLIDIKTRSWENAFETINQINSYLNVLSEQLDSKIKKTTGDEEKFIVDFREILIHRGYMIHWGLFLLEANEQGIDQYLSLLFHEKNLSLVANSFTSLIKYGVVLTIISKSKTSLASLRGLFDNLTANSTIDKVEPFCALFEALFVSFDLDAVTQSLQDCRKLMEEDYFLHTFADLLQAKAREVMLENYLQLNNSFEINEYHKYFSSPNESPEKEKEELTLLIKYHYPGATITVDGSTISYQITETTVENIHLLKASQLFDLTKNMIDFINENN